MTTIVERLIAARNVIDGCIAEMQEPPVIQPPVVPPPVEPPPGPFHKVWLFDVPVPTVVGEPWRRDVNGDVTDCVSLSFVPHVGMESLRITYAQMPIPRTTFYSLSTLVADFDPAHTLDNRGGRSCANASIVVSTTGRAGHIAVQPGQRYYFNVKFSSAAPGTFGYEFRLEAQN